MRYLKKILCYTFLKLNFINFVLVPTWKGYPKRALKEVHFFTKVCTHALFISLIIPIARLLDVAFLQVKAVVYAFCYHFK